MTRRTSVTAAVLATLLLATAGSAQDLARGEALYGLCTQCHGAEGAGDPLALAPSIAGQHAWYVETQLKNFKNGLRGLHPQDTGGLRMYPMSLAIKTDEDIADLAAYVASMPVPEQEVTVAGDAEAGKAYYAPCTACHGPDGMGNQALNAPRIAHQSDWYLVESLKKFKAGIRGGDPANQNAVMMRGMALSLPDDQAIRDVVAYIHTLGE